MTNGTFSGQQVEYLLKPLNKARVETRSQQGQTLSYINQADMRAHAIRLFGFGNFDIETIEVNMVFEEPTKTKNGSDAWHVGWKATVQVTIRNPRGEQVCRYSESAIGQSTQPQRGEAHDMALKTATSDAMKRCFINIGDQGGLGLYNNGSTNAMVKDTIVKPGVQSLNEPDLPAPDSDEPGLSPEAVEFLGELSALCEETDSKARILGIAGLKSKYAGLGSVFSPVHEVTLGVLADRVAATGTM